MMIVLFSSKGEKSVKEKISKKTNENNCMTLEYEK
jgi:hypothetical protein